MASIDEIAERNFKIMVSNEGINKVLFGQTYGHAPDSPDGRYCAWAGCFIYRKDGLIAQFLGNKIRKQVKIGRGLRELIPVRFQVARDKEGRKEIIDAWYFPCENPFEVKLISQATDAITEMGERAIQRSIELYNQVQKRSSD